MGNPPILAFPRKGGEDISFPLYGGELEWGLYQVFVELHEGHLLEISADDGYRVEAQPFVRQS